MTTHDRGTQTATEGLQVQYQDQGVQVNTEIAESGRVLPRVIKTSGSKKRKRISISVVVWEEGSSVTKRRKND